MKILIVARHGYYRGSDLHEIGELQMKALGSAIKSALNGFSVQIVSSNAPRAEQSAEIIAEILGVGFEKHEFLWTGPGSPRGCSPDLQSALKLIEASKADVLIIVTHLEYSEKLPNFFGRNVLKVSSFPSEETDKGHAWVIDCEAKTCTKLAPELLKE